MTLPVSTWSLSEAGGHSPFEECGTMISENWHPPKCSVLTFVVETFFLFKLLWQVFKHQGCPSPDDKLVADLVDYT